MSYLSLPQDLYKINLNLQGQITKLIQENATNWFQQTQNISSKEINNSKSQVESLLQNVNWSNVLVLPPEVFQKVVQTHWANVDEISQVALKNQADFVQGLQDALLAWQKNVAEIFEQSLEKPKE